MREQLLLGDVLMYVDVRRLTTEHRGIVLLAYRDDDVQRFIAEAGEQRPKHVEVTVVDRTERDIDERPPAQSIQPREMRRRWLSLDSADALRRTRNRSGYLEAGRAHVEVQVAVEAAKGVGREAARAPERRSGLAGGTDEVIRKGGSIAVLYIRDAAHGCDERSGELRHV